MQADITAGEMRDDATLLHAQTLRPAEGQLDACRISTRSNDKVVFQLALIAVEDEIYTRKYLVIANAGVIGDSIAPAARIITYKVRTSGG